MFKGILHKENKSGQIWKSENRRWIITKQNIPGGVSWSIDNFHVPYHDKPIVLTNGEVIFNKAAGLPTYVREEFLKMLEKHITLKT